MKLITLFTLLLASLSFIGCASSGSPETTSGEEAPVMEHSSAGVKTAYDGSTGAGLLMERYKAGQIEGYRE